MTDLLEAIVIGGGVGGLVAARALARGGVAPLLLEARKRCGGLVFGDRLGPLRVDLGAESFARRGVATARLCRDLGLEVIEPAGQSYIWRHQDAAAFAMPRGVLGIPVDLDDPEVAAILTPEGLARARADLTMDPSEGADATDLATLAETRLGTEVLERLVTPVAGGVHSANPRDLAADIVIPGLRARFAAEGSLVRAAASLRAGAPPGPIVSSVRGGLWRLPEALVADIEAHGGEVWTEKLVTHIARAADGWAVTVENRRPGAHTWLPGEPDGDAWTLHARRLVVALDGHGALPLLRGIPELEIGDWHLATGAHLAQVALAVEHEALDAAPRGSGLLVSPPVPGATPSVRAKALTHYSAKWPWVVADQPVHALRISYGRPGEPTPEPTLAQALADASTLLGIDLETRHVRGMTVVRFGPSLPPHTPAHRARVAELQARIADLDGFAVTGAWFAGTGLAAVVAHAESVGTTLGGVA